MRRTPSPTAAESLVLGLAVSSRTLHGVLVESTPEGPRLLRTLSRTRGESLIPAAASPSGAYVLAEGGEEAPGTLQIGEATTGGELFLTSEFGSLGAAVPGLKIGGTPTAQHDLFASEILDMVAEVRDALGQEPALAFVSAPEDMTYAQIHVAPQAKEKADRRRARLLAVLGEQVHDVDQERTVFLPVTSASDEQVHALALVPRVADPVTQSLASAMTRRRSLRPLLLDAEVPLLMGLARLAPATPAAPAPYDDFYGAGSMAGDGASPSELPTLIEDTLDFDTDLPVASEPAPSVPELPAPVVVEGTTLVLRAGVEDTLAVFMKDGQAVYFERMRSVTAFDAPETICSRVLLIQDEHNVGDLGRILLLGEQGETDLSDAFSLFFPDARVGSLRMALPDAFAMEALAQTATAPVLALAVSLRLAGAGETLQAFPQVNFLPSALTRRRFVVPYSWHVYLLLGLIFATVLFFMARYFTTERQIDAQRELVRSIDPASAEANVQQLQVRLDSLQGAQQRYAHALGVLDSLLLGSDKWSRALDLVSREAASVRGVWVENWEQNGNEITLNGNAIRREQVVAFAERTGGNLQSVTFEEIRDFPTYSFKLTIPLANDLPEAVRYLRDIAQQQANLTAQPGAMPTIQAAPAPAPAAR